MNLKNIVKKSEEVEVIPTTFSMANKLAFVQNPEYVDKQLESINEMLNRRNYSLLNGIPTLSSEMYRPRQISRDQIRRAVLNPYANVETLQQASMLLKATNGIYKKILNYQSTILTNDYMIYPVYIDKIKTAEKMDKAYQEIAIHLNKFNIKETACWIYERVLEQGELYLYKLEDNTGVVMQEIPNSLCKITSMQNNIHKYGVNLAKITDKTVVTMPLEIQNAYDKFKSGKLKDSDLIDRTFYEVKENGVAFNLDKYATKGIPFFATAFDDLMELEDMKDLKSETAIIESIKLIHQKLPIDKETGVVLMDFNVAKAYHNATKANLPKGTSITTNPLDLQTLTLGDSGSKINDSVAQSLNNIYDTMGINNELFNGSHSTTQAIVSGIVADGLLTKRLQMLVENWLNYELSMYKKNGTIWGLKFIDSTHFDKEARAKTAREDMAFGGMRTEYLASKGYTPLESRNLLKMEQLLGFDTLMIPQQSAHTTSNTTETTSSDVKEGRPKEDVTISE